METLMQLSTDIGLSILKIQKIWCKILKRYPFALGLINPRPSALLLSQVPLAEVQEYK